MTCFDIHIFMTVVDNNRVWLLKSHPVPYTHIPIRWSPLGRDSDFSWEGKGMTD